MIKWDDHSHVHDNRVQFFVSKFSNFQWNKTINKNTLNMIN